MEITAKEIERQAGRVDEEVVNFYKSANAVINMLLEMTNIVKSDDSNLARTIDTYTTHYIKLQTTIKNNFGNLANIMHEYASRTLQNEETTAEEVSKAADELESVVDSASSLSQSTHSTGTNSSQYGDIQNMFG